MVSRTKFLLGAVMALSLLFSAAGPTAAQAQGIYVDYYTPQFYVDNLVFYDDTGTPYYYDNDEAWSVPEEYHAYQDLVDHYLEHVVEYLDWFDEVGYMHLDYRRPARVDYYELQYYQDYPVFFKKDGRPYYYVDGSRVFINISDPFYNALRRHYLGHRDSYRRWNRERGRHYRWYRRPLHTDYYRPMYHDGFVLYFDLAGLPFYYMGGRKVFVDRHHRHFNLYKSHYRGHKDHYRRWYKKKGRHHHNYRKSKRHHRRVLKKSAPRSSRGRAVDRAEHRRNRRIEKRENRRDHRLEKRDRRRDHREDRRDRLKEKRERDRDRREDRQDRLKEKRDREREERQDRLKEKRERDRERQDRLKEKRDRDRDRDRREDRQDRLKEKRDRDRKKKERLREKRQDRREDRRDRRVEKREKHRDRKIEKKERRQDRREKKKDKRKDRRKDRKDRRRNK